MPESIIGGCKLGFAYGYYITLKEKSSVLFFLDIAHYKWYNSRYIKKETVYEDYS